MKTPANIDFIRESFITIISDSLDKIAAFIAFVYFANFFSTGSFGAAYTVIGISMVTASAPKAIAKAISKRVSEDTQQHERYFILGLASIIIYSTLIALAVGIIVIFWDSKFEYLALAGITHMAGRSSLYVVERIYDGTGNPGAAASLDFLDGVLTAGLRFVLILGLGFGEAGLLYSGAISAVLVGFVAYLFKYGIPSDLPRLRELENIKSYAGWSLLSGISGQALHNAPTVLAGIFLSPSVASWIKSAETLVLPANLSVRAVRKSIFVQVSGDLERGELDITPIQNGIDVASIIAIPIMAGAMVMGDQLMVTVYGEGYAGTGLFLTAIAAVMILKSETSILMSVLNGSDNPDVVGKINAAHAILAAGIFSGALTLFGAELFLIGLIGVYGNWFVTSYLFIDNKVVDTNNLSWKFVAEQLMASTVMAIVLEKLLSFWGVGSWLTLIPPIFLGAMIYAAVLISISKRCRRIIRTIARRIKPEY